MSTRIDPREYLTLEAVLVRRLQRDWAAQARKAFPAINRAIEARDWGEAVALVEKLDLSDIGHNAKSLAYSVFRGCIDFGAQTAAGGRSMTSSLAFDQTVKRVVSQWLQSIEWSVTLQVQKRVLKSIAEAQQTDVGIPITVQKAAAVRPFVTFQQSGDEMLQLVSSLHTSRLGSWGFVAESDLMGWREYKLNAVLDGRTSEFCRLIHGKTFRIDDARGIIDQAVHADDPNALKEIQPWPRQTAANLKMFSGMSADEMVAAKLHVPPFHPGCRTLMVPVSDKTRLKKPVVTQQVLPEYDSTREDFKTIGLPISKKQLATWNDYVHLNPVDVFQRLSGAPVQDVLAQKIKGSVRVGTTDMVRVSWNALQGKFKGLVEFDPHAGILNLTRRAFSSETDGYAKSQYLKHYHGAVKDLAQSIAAEKMTMTVPLGEAVQALTLGFVPDAYQWQMIRQHLLEKLDGSLKSKFDKFTPSQKLSLLSLLTSKLESSASKLVQLDIPDSFTATLLKDVAFKGQYKL